MLSGGLFSSAAKSANAEHVAVTNLINDSLGIFQDILLLQRIHLISAASKKILYQKTIQQSWVSTVKQKCYDFVSAFFLSTEELLLPLYEDVLREVSMAASFQKEAAVHDLVIVELAITLIERSKDHFQPKTSAGNQAYLLEFLLSTLDKFPAMKHASATVYDHLSPHIVTLSENLKSINADLPIKMKAAKMLWNTTVTAVVPTEPLSSPRRRGPIPEFSLSSLEKPANISIDPRLRGDDSNSAGAAVVAVCTAESSSPRMPIN